MGLGAIVIVDAEERVRAGFSPETRATEAKDLIGQPLSCVEIFGRSLLEHALVQLIRANLEAITVLVHADVLPLMPQFRGRSANVTVEAADEVWFAAASTLNDYARSGIDHAFVLKANSYVEVNLADLLHFHVEGQRPVTRAADREGPLDLWVAHCDTTWQAEPGTSHADTAAHKSYFVKEYSKRVDHPRDIRQLVTDAFIGRCQLSPVGREIRPGVWADEGVEIRNRARIVAPAYLGARSTIREDALVTRFSNIESFSYIDYGTAVEDTSVLSNTYVGIWLDVRHAVVNGSKLLNLSRNVLVEISDPSLIRSNAPIHHNNNEDARKQSRLMSLV